MIFKCAGCEGVFQTNEYVGFYVQPEANTAEKPAGLCPACTLATVKAMQDNLALLSGSRAEAPPLTQGIINGRTADDGK